MISSFRKTPVNQKFMVGSHWPIGMDHGRLKTRLKRTSKLQSVAFRSLILRIRPSQENAFLQANRVLNASSGPSHISPIH